MAAYFESKLTDLFNALTDSAEMSEYMKKTLSRRKKKQEKLKEKKYIKPAARVPRNPMGAYIVPPGEQPLTSLEYETPGPATYTPCTDLTFPTAPQYSLMSSVKKKRIRKGPAPGAYNIAKDMVWPKRNHLTMKICLPRKEPLGPPPAVGPATYKPKEIKTGDSGPKYSMGIKEALTGPPNILVAPTDTKGFETPGPNYVPSTEKWGDAPEQSFGVKHNVLTDDFPSPAEYPAHEPDKGLAYSLGIRHFVENNGDDPGPTTYHIKSHLGSALGISMLGHPLDPTLHIEGASPATFFVKRNLNTNGKSMTYRPFIPNVEETPSPQTYKPEKEYCKEYKTTFSCRRNCCPTFPESPVSVRKYRVEVKPGPAEYNIVKNFSENDKPAFTMRSQLKLPKKKSPGPAEYIVKRNDDAPAYSMAKHLQRVLDSCEESPSPNSYMPKIIPNNAPAYTILANHKPKPPAHCSPGPTAYDYTVKKDFKTTPTFKTRASPWVYSGFEPNRKLQNRITSHSNTVNK